MARRGNRNLGPRARGYEARLTERRQPRARILIGCEGERTEPLYFTAFPVTNVEIRVVGTGMNTRSLVAEIVRLRDEYAGEGKRFDQVWAVFDRDSFSMKSVHEAFALAERAGVRVAFSNEAFELWYLLHFMYCDAALARSQYATKLGRYLGEKYAKNNPRMYELLRPHLPASLKHARQLARAKPGRDNPSTTVHLLVEELLRWTPDAREQ